MTSEVTAQDLTIAHSYLVVPRARREGFERRATAEDGEAWTRDGGVTVMWSIATEADGRPWLHASLARRNTLPTYADMQRLHNVFVGDNRYAYEVRAPRSVHVNIHEHALHMWAVMDGGPEPLPDFTRGTRSL